VFPRSKGGEHTWENVVTACKNCNSEKADLLIEEWGREHPNPKRPHYLLMLKKNAVSIIPEEWKPFLFY
jgi:5-methylcytosine-specific restriction endonuclease McrA